MESVVQAFVSQPLRRGVTPALRALWHAAHGDWTAAHEEAQQGNDTDSAWVHALLHREEGDEGNAAYWYRKAGKPVYLGPIAVERAAIITALLKEEGEA